MTKAYIDAFYHEGITMEERLFLLGEKNTRISVTTWLGVLIAGIFLEILGYFMVFSFIGDAGEVIGWILAVPGSIMFLVSIYFLWSYLFGLRCLERAELLYNTRLAGKEESAEQIAMVEEFRKELEAAQAEKRANKAESVESERTYDADMSAMSGSWKCVCGRENPGYVSSCACGKNKHEQ